MALTAWFRRSGSLTANEARRFLDNHRAGSYTLLDVRQPGEYEAGHIPGARLLPLAELPDALDDLDRELPVIVYCSLGARSAVAARLLVGRGFREVYNLVGGLQAWAGPRVADTAEFHLPFLGACDTPGKLLALAYDMEKGLKIFYETFRDKPGTAAGVVQLFASLACTERRHTELVLSLARSCGLGDADFDPDTRPAFIEGGADFETFMRGCENLLRTPHGILQVALMCETQALDLYLHLVDDAPDQRARHALAILAEEEKKHLRDLATLLENYPAA